MTASSLAAARLKRSQQRAPDAAVAAAQTDAPPFDAKGVFDGAYDACISGDFEKASVLLGGVLEQDGLQTFESRALPGMLMLGREGVTMLHLAAQAGSVTGVVSLLRLGASASQKDKAGQSSIDVAQAAGHEDLSALLQAHSDAWLGWGITELSALAALYRADDAQFADADAYLGRLVERDRARRGPDGAGGLFKRPLPSGLCMLDIATRLDTPGAAMIRAEFGVGELEVSAPGAAPDQAPPADPDEPASDEAWPEDGWQANVGYFCCVLCRGASGAAGRWGTAAELAPHQLRHPLKVCRPCQERCPGLVEQDVPAAAWVQNTLLLEVREGAPPEPRVTQLAHPVVGVVAAAADVAVAPPPPAGAPPMAPPAAD